MSTIIDQIREEINIIKRKYLDSADEIISAYRSEGDFKKSYSGRQVYELLQNADDGATDENGYVRFEYSNGILTVSNTGLPFSFDGIKSLMRPYTSPKTNQIDKIGSKGLGFRSVLSWASKIEILTKDFAVEFSKDNAIDFYEAIISEKSELLTEIKKKTSVDYPISVLSCPKIQDYVLKDSEFDTVIKIYCNDDGVLDIKKQFADFQSKEMVFLPKLKKIEFFFENEINLRFEKCTQNNIVNIKCTNFISDNIDNGIGWQLFYEEGTLDIELDNDDESFPDYKIIIAYDVDGHTSGEYLYSYFRTDVEFDFPALIHATFELSPDRNQIVKTLYNKMLFSKIASGLVNVACKVAENSKEANYDALKLVLSTKVSSFLRDSFDFKTLLYDYSKKAKILPTIKNEYVSFDDNPKYSRYEYASILKAEDFPLLLKCTDESDIDSFLRSSFPYGFGLSFYDHEEFKDSINLTLDKYSIEDKSKLIYIIKNDYLYKNRELFPNLLVDSNGNIIENGNTVFLNDGRNIDIPTWVNVGLLNKTMSDKLMNLFNESSIEGLCNELSEFGLRQYRFSNLYSKIIHSIKTITEIDIQNSKYNEVFYWLWELYKNNPNMISNIDEDIFVLCRNGEYKAANECFFGSEYDNQIGERIISVYSEDSFISGDIIVKDDKIRFISFLKEIGVSKYPHLITIDINNSNSNDRNEFWKYIRNHENKKFRECFAQLGHIQTMKVEIFENFNLLLRELNVNDLILWMIDDENFSARLNCPSEFSEKSEYTGYVDQTHSGDRVRLNQYNYRKYKHDEIPSYIIYQLRRKEWINVNDSDKKVSPEFCIREKLNLEPIIYTPFIDENYICKELGFDCRKELDIILYKVGVSDGFTSLRKETIYKVLNNLKNTDPNGLNAKRVYKLVKDYCRGDSVDTLISNNPEYDKFKKEGYVFVLENGIGKYVRNNEAYYSNIKIFSNDIIKQYPFIVVDYKAGLRKIMSLFCVNELKSIQTTLVSFKENRFNYEFQKYYEDFVPYVLACKYISNKNVEEHRRSLKKYTINICDNIQVKYNSNDSFTYGDIEEYQFFVDENEKSAVRANAYISISNDKFSSFEHMVRNLEFADAIAETICFILKSEEDKQFIRDLFVNSEEDRKYKMRNDKYDENLSDLYKAIRELRTINDYKLYFLQTLCDVKKIDYAENESIDDLLEALELTNNDIDELDFNSFADGEFKGPYDKLIVLMKKVNVDIDILNMKTGFDINVLPWWEMIHNQLKQEFKYDYLMNLYNSLKDKTDGVNEYLKVISSYNDMPENITNSAFVNIYHILEDTYNIDFKTHRFTLDDYKTIIDANIKKLENEKLLEIRKEFSQQEIEAYALFDMLNELIDNNNIEEEKVYSDAELRNVSENSSNSSNDVIIQKASLQLPNEIRNDNKATSFRKSFNATKNSSKANETKKIAGSVGEKLVYDKLREKYAVDWVSGYAESNKVIPRGKGDDTLGYDMKYIDNNGETHYIEVKATVGDEIEFTMSENEKEAADRYKANYSVIFVMLDKDNDYLAKHIYQLDLFDFIDGESFDNNSRFSVEIQKKYIVRTEIIDSSDMNEAEDDNQPSATERLAAIGLMGV